ncbi:neuropeptide FF receptor 2-like [Oculina patagonica]
MSTDLNTTINATQPSDCSIQGLPSNHKAAKIGATFAYSLIVVVSLAGNSLIAIIVFKTKPMRRTINYFIVNMAISDLLYPVFIIPLLLIELYGGFGIFTGHLGQAFCKVQMLLQYISCLVSVGSLVLIAVDRFGAVVFPFRPQLISSKMCPFFILATWFVTIVLSLPAFFAYRPVEYARKMRCEWLYKDTLAKIYSHTMPIVFSAISFSLMIILYSIILFKLKSQKIPGEQSVNAEEQRSKMHKNVFKMVGAIVIGFVLCWTPVSVLNFLYAFVWDSNTSLPCGIATYHFAAVFMAQANCAVNPCICFTFSGNYRQGLKSLFGC